MTTVQSSVANQRAYRDKGYVLLEQLFPPIVLGLFHGKLKKDLNLAGNSSFVSMTPLLTKPALEVYSGRYAPMATFHWGLTPTVAAIAGCDLVPSYAYFRIYQKDDVCRVHPDRPACEHSMSLTIESADDMPWALCIGNEHADAHEPAADEGFQVGESYTELPMRAGDAVMYRGVNHRHGRVDPNPNRWSAHLFMHWVNANGPFADHAFDRAAVEKLMAEAR